MSEKVINDKGLLLNNIPYDKGFLEQICIKKSNISYTKNHCYEYKLQFAKGICNVRMSAWK